MSESDDQGRAEGLVFGGGITPDLTAPCVTPDLNAPPKILTAPPYHNIPIYLTCIINHYFLTDPGKFLTTPGKMRK